MSNSARTCSVIVAAALFASACSSLGLPKRGFVTRYFAGSDLQKSVKTTDDFGGRQFHPAIETYTGPASVQRWAGTSATLARAEDTCMSVARQRATDAAFQGFGEATQKSIFDSIYRDCIAWRANH